jgi:hypothetical protein
LLCLGLALLLEQELLLLLLLLLEQKLLLLHRWSSHVLRCASWGHHLRLPW